MSKSAPSDAGRTPATIALAVMLLACGLILTALVFLAQGAVAAEPAEPVRQQSDAATVSGRFLLGAEPTDLERRLAAEIEASSVGGGFVLGAEMHVDVEARRVRTQR